MPLMNINKNINKLIPFVIFENDKFESKDIFSGTNKISCICFNLLRLNKTFNERKFRFNRTK